jgi:phosphoesterase RecJ-like protein
MMKGIIFAALIIDRKELVKLSLRSKGEFDVNRFVREHFGGGGHKNAAGANTNLSLDKATQKLISLLPQYSDLLNKQQ